MEHDNLFWFPHNINKKQHKLSKQPGCFFHHSHVFPERRTPSGHAPSFERDVQLIIQPPHAHVCWSSIVYLYDNEEADLAVISIQYAYNAKLY